MSIKLRAEGVGEAGTQDAVTVLRADKRGTWMQCVWESANEILVGVETEVMRGQRSSKAAACRSSRCGPLVGASLFHHRPCPLSGTEVVRSVCGSRIPHFQRRNLPCSSMLVPDHACRKLLKRSLSPGEASIGGSQVQSQPELQEPVSNRQRRRQRGRRGGRQPLSSFLWPGL